MRKVWQVLQVLMVVFLITGVSQASFFTDPTSLYCVVIPEHWVYQANQSNSSLITFYSEGEVDLLYFEQLYNVFDSSPSQFARRTLELYAAPGGLKNFVLQEPPQPCSVAGIDGVWCVYTFEDGRGNNVWEHRIFLILPDQRGFTLTLSGMNSWNGSERDILRDLLTSWRWLL